MGPLLIPLSQPGLTGSARRRFRGLTRLGLATTLMNIALYARVSTRDKDQDPELQLVPMREYATARGWDAVEYVDQASASDFGRRTDWRRLLDDARRRRVDLVAVWKLDRGFRSTVECLRALEDWQARGVGFVCVSQPELDTTTPIGRLLLTVLAAVAEFERELIRERVREGMANARRKGSAIGRPTALVKHPRLRRQWAALESQVRAGDLSQRQAASLLRVGRATVQRLLAAS
jgi:DNA invertase Pin-like site-specific DNA recombinase